MQPDEKQKKRDGDVVYHRISSPEAEQNAQKQSARRLTPAQHSIAPTLTPLVVGFVLLLALVGGLGYLSVQKLDDVSRNVLDREQQHAAKLGLLLRLRVAVNRLNNEARTRARDKSEGGIRNPFGLTLSNARKETEQLLNALNSPAFSQLDNWHALRADLATFIEITKDLTRYDNEGFKQFGKVDDNLEAILSDVTIREQDEIGQQREELEQSARRSINFLTLIALLTGAIVAAGTIWEVQRRFRQMRRSFSEAQREREYSAQMLEGMVSAVVAIDAQDHIRSANAAFFKIFPKAATGLSVHDQFASPDAIKMLESAIASSRTAHANYRGRWVCGAEDASCNGKIFDVYSSPLAIEGGRGQIVTLVDVTASVEAENAVRRAESLAAVGRASAQVAHEIRNPLGSIRLGVSMLRDMTRDADSLNTIDLVERGINHLNKLVIDVTQFSGQKALNRAETDLHSLLDTSLELVSDRIEEKGTPVEKQYSEHVLRGQWDADRLRQVFVNLLANAIDASQQHSPLTISTTRVALEDRTNGQHDGGAMSDKQQFARVSIADQGSGMNEETRARLFEPFFTTKKRGTGLGLAISKQIIEQHGGAIAVESAPGKGTRFVIDLPI